MVAISLKVEIQSGVYNDGDGDGFVIIVISLVSRRGFLK